jgi:hypothetical protein
MLNGWLMLVYNLLHLDQKKDPKVKWVTDYGMQPFICWLKYSPKVKWVTDPGM